MKLLMFPSSFRRSFERPVTQTQQGVNTHAQHIVEYSQSGEA